MKKGVPTTKDEHEDNESDIYGIIMWWKKLEPDFADLQTLIHKRRVLAAMYVMISKYRKEQQKILSRKKFLYEICVAKFSRMKQSQNKEGTAKAYSQASAHEIAIAEYEDQGLEVEELIGTLEGLKFIARAVDETLGAMQQEIAHLRGVLGDKDRASGDNYSTQRQQQSVT